MIKNIEFINYKKLKDVTIELKKGVNVIAGTNGTCKSSILHIISNTYKMIPLNAEYFKDKNCVKTIKDLNKSLTPKIESLTKAHLNYNPDEKINGDILKVEFMDNKVQAFRNHKSDKYKRYAIKPYYPRGKKERLREAMVIYLSVDRLLSFGEFLDDSSISKVNKILPEKINSELIEKYREFTFYKIKEMKTEKMGSMKIRGRFETEEVGIDSNTISVGEDNLIIILSALYSLKYFCEELKEEYKSLSAILLIDEFDAALHPEFQIKLLNLFTEFCKKYPNMQIIFTSHSISALEGALIKKHNIIYLVDDISSVEPLKDPDISKINSLLQNKLHSEIAAFKAENPNIYQKLSNVTIFYKEEVINICKKMKIYDKVKPQILAYFDDFIPEAENKLSDDIPDQNKKAELLLQVLPYIDEKSLRDHLVAKIIRLVDHRILGEYKSDNLHMRFIESRGDIIHKSENESFRSIVVDGDAKDIETPPNTFITNCMGYKVMIQKK